MAPSKFLFPIQQKGQTTSLITSTMTFFLAIGKKSPGQRSFSFLAAKKNNRNLEALFFRKNLSTTLKVGQVADPEKREVYLCFCQTSMVFDPYLWQISSTQQHNQQATKGFLQKKKLQTCSFQPIQTHLSNVFAWHKKADTKTLALPTIFNLSFSLSHRGFSPDRADPLRPSQMDASTSSCDRFGEASPRKATGLPTFHESAPTAGG